jgi:hypothetical protein
VAIDANGLAEMLGELFPSTSDLKQLAARVERLRGGAKLRRSVNLEAAPAAVCLELVDALQSRGLLNDDQIGDLIALLLKERPGQEKLIRGVLGPAPPALAPPARPPLAVADESRNVAPASGPRDSMPSAPPTAVGAAAPYGAGSEGADDLQNDALEVEYDIFFAHASPDKALAGDVVQRLREGGLRVFFDAELRDGAWDQQIPAALRASALVACLCSGEYPEAHYFRDEVQLAVQLHRRDAARWRLRPIGVRGFPGPGGHWPYGLAVMNAIICGEGQGAAWIAGELLRDFGQAAPPRDGAAGRGPLFASAPFGRTLPPAQMPPPRVSGGGVRVLISYAHEQGDGRVAARVAELAAALRSEGIDAWIDQYMLPGGPAEGWPRWMDRMVRQANFVVCVCTPTWAKRVEGREALEVGKGVAWEGNLLYNMLYDAKLVSAKVVLVTLDGFLSELPLVLLGRHVHAWASGHAALVQTLKGQRAPIPELAGVDSSAGPPPVGLPDGAIAARGEGTRARATKRGAPPTDPALPPATSTMKVPDVPAASKTEEPGGRSKPRALAPGADDVLAEARLDAGVEPPKVEPGRNEPKYDVFISFARVRPSSDARPSETVDARPGGLEDALILRTVLASTYGKKAFVDQEDIELGARSSIVMRNELQGAPVTVAVLGPATLASSHQLGEIATAIEIQSKLHNRRVVPWIRRGAPPLADWPSGLRDFQGSDLNAGDFAAKLAAACGWPAMSRSTTLEEPAPRENDARRVDDGVRARGGAPSAGGPRRRAAVKSVTAVAAGGPPSHQSQSIMPTPVAKGAPVSQRSSGDRDAETGAPGGAPSRPRGSAKPKMSSTGSKPLVEAATADAVAGAARLAVYRELSDYQNRALLSTLAARLNLVAAAGPELVGDTWLKLSELDALTTLRAAKTGLAASGPAERVYEVLVGARLGVAAARHSQATALLKAATLGGGVLDWTGVPLSVGLVNAAAIGLVAPVRLSGSSGDGPPVVDRTLLWDHEGDAPFLQVRVSRKDALVTSAADQLNITAPPELFYSRDTSLIQYVKDSTGARVTRLADLAKYLVSALKEEIDSGEPETGLRMVVIPTTSDTEAQAHVVYAQLVSILSELMPTKRPPVFLLGPVADEETAAAVKAFSLLRRPR